MHPIAFKIGNFPVYFYGLMMVVAFGITILVMRKTRRYENLDMETALDCTIYGIIGGVSGARIFYVLLNLSEYYQSPLNMLNIREGGLSWHGALIGGFIGMLVLSMVKKIPVGVVSDFMSVHITLALAIGRIGCFLNGCCYGKETDVPWGVVFREAGIEGKRHPTQLYESVLTLMVFFILLSWWKKKKFNGEMTLAMFGTYGIIRFIVEFFRYNTPNQYPGGVAISLAQYFSIMLFVGCFTVIILKRTKLSTAGNKDIKDNEKPEANQEGDIKN